MFELQNLKAEVARKADSWQVNNLSNEITQLKNQVQQLSEKLDQAYSMIHLADDRFQRLKRALTASEILETDDDLISEIHNIN